MAVNRLKVKDQKNEVYQNPMTFARAIGRTFKFSEYMHINVGNKNMHNNYLSVTSLRVKGQTNKSQQFFVQPKGFEPLMLDT